ncbi:hypothetical protein CBS101457_002342 [Exobasidium rhododendri]|nr:hypothetical protein CBS101457_002342 [Exobasidium rhododendri]
MPPRFAVSAPKCARCGKSVFVAEQVIGPSSKPYHKPCLSCSVCEKRLDSTLLVEHDGQPYCKNCHKAHLGQGKGGFGLAVPLRPEIHKPPPKPESLSSSKHDSARYLDQSKERQRREDDANEQRSGINLSSRGDSSYQATRQEYRAPTLSAPAESNSRPVTSIDDMVASGMEIPMLSGKNGDTAKNELYQSMYGGNKDEPGRERQGSPGLSNMTPSRPSSAVEQSNATPPIPVQVRSSSPLRKAVLPPSMSGREVIGSVRVGLDGLPTPNRRDPVALSRERDRELSGNTGTAKTYSPRTAPQHSPANRSPTRAYDDSFNYSPASALNKMGLGSTVSAAVVGTPLCARCERPVYFAEQKQAAGRKWHRGCLRCDGCSTTLESGRMEEGPPSATYENQTNIWCRTCYAKRFGPKGIGNAGMSLPEMMK